MFFTTFFMMAASMMRTVPIDSHLHVWSDGSAPFPYSVGGPPPADLALCNAEHLIAQQTAAKVGGALIVQPINHGFDHSYVQSVLDHPSGARFKGMCLLDPKQPTEQGVVFLRQMRARGWVGVRFNPYLWPEGEPLSGPKGRALFGEAGALGMPVGFMCFKGLKLHHADIVELLEAHPNTQVLIDHWGFFLQGEADEVSWGQLLGLARYPQVHVKVSALFRVSQQQWPFADLDPRFVALKEAFGARRLLWGSDYPYVQQHGGYEKSLSALAEWRLTDDSMQQQEWEAVLRGTAESLFGKWP
ncbi:hypothetical protein B484DRAFT_459569 [Ochromonadaceae sp. CCMP2298]|nr:hypothetical protein B484DRAFT_459569 [Ochromonadaceae sp. CCMP2298]